ncbi:hypothetical protein CU084_11860 [Bacillus velezensis]|nr:hypothetical protein CU084_11860 [Bacillus velezensis]
MNSFFIKIEGVTVGIAIVYIVIMGIVRSTWKRLREKTAEFRRESRALGRIAQINYIIRKDGEFSLDFPQLYNDPTLSQKGRVQSMTLI